MGHSTFALSFALWFGGSFSLIQIRRSKVSLLLFKFLLDLNIISVCYTKQGDVQELHLYLDVFIQKVIVLEYWMLLKSLIPIFVLRV